MSLSRTVSNIGSNVTLNCSALGGPKNTYYWRRRLIDEFIPNEYENTLNVTDIDASSGDLYTCLVINAAGRGSASTTLYVAPYIVTPLEEQTLTANGSNVNINCNAAGFPSPTVTWVDMRNMTVSNSSLLQFNPIMFGDEGVYSCVVSAEINGMPYSVTNKTTVVSKLRVASTIYCINSYSYINY